MTEKAPDRQADAPKRRKQIACATAIILLAALLIRLHHLDHESLWMDEIDQVSFYGHTFGEIIKNAASQQQPPLDYWIGHIVFQLSGSDFAARIPAALFGVGSIFLLMLLIARAHSWAPAFVAGALMALLPFHIYFSQEARPYSIAIFLFLATLWSLDRAVAKDSAGIWRFVLLGLCTILFLYSRMLSPLVVYVLLVFMLLLRLMFRIRRERSFATGEQKRLFFAAGAMILPLVVYLPILKGVFNTGKRYLDETAGNGLHILPESITDSWLFPLWKTYITQLEPIGHFLFPFVIVAFLLALWLSPWRKSFLISTAAFLLPAASLLHIVIFRSRTSYMFRPPYAIYILPLVLFLAAIVFAEMWNHSRNMSRPKPVIRALILCAAGLFLLHTALSASSFKSTPRKTDWRGLTEYLENNFGAGHLMIFDSLSPFGKWEPTFHGFPRYYGGQSPGFAVNQVPTRAAAMVSLSAEPVFILFQWRPYSLTPKSKFHIMGEKWPLVDYAAIATVPTFDVKEFTGFSVIRLKFSSGNLPKDMLTIINTLVPLLPSDSTLVELHLAAASLAGTLGLPEEQYHVEKALSLTPPDELSHVSYLISRMQGREESEE